MTVAKDKSNPPSLYGWTARGVSGNPIMQTYLPLLNSYGGNFANDDWSPASPVPRAWARSSGCSSSSPTCPAGLLRSTPARRRP